MTIYRISSGQFGTSRPHFPVNIQELRGLTDSHSGVTQFMNHHILLKFTYLWKTDKGSFVTIEEHQSLITTMGYCWWGSASAISVEKVEVLKRQVQERTLTLGFLYSIKVPSQVNEDKNLWFVGTITDINLGRPDDTNGLPQYYRGLDLPVYFKFTDFRAVRFPEGQTPKVPGQSAMRHVSYRGKPEPMNVFSINDPDVPLCRQRSGDEVAADEEITQITTSAGSTLSIQGDDSAIDYKQRLIDLQDDVITLHQQVSELRSYRDYYNKILNTDYLFSSEKFLETWIQENIHRIFPEVEILDRQPFAKWPDGKFGRLDLLGMNKESKGLVIIEIKTRKRAAKSGYDQYLRYTSWARRQFAKLTAEYNDKGLVDTGHIEFTIITDYVDDEMKAICKDHGIALVHLFGGLGFDRVA